MSDILNAYWAAPPIARTVTAAIVITTAGVMLRLIPLGWLLFVDEKVFTFPPQIWRFFTTFLITRPMLGMLFDPYFTYQFLSQLEGANPKFAKREDLIWYLLTVCGFIVLGNRAMMGFPQLLPGLIVALAYTACQDKRGAKVTWLVLPVPAQALPFCMILTDFMFGGGHVHVQILGLLAAHLHDFLTRLWPEFGGGRNLWPTPGFLGWFTQLLRDYGFIISRSGQEANSRASGRSTGALTGSVLPESWKTRGPGRRLGGD